MNGYIIYFSNVLGKVFSSGRLSDVGIDGDLCPIYYCIDKAQYQINHILHEVSSCKYIGTKFT